MDYKAAIFDLDGTLLDSMWVWDRLLVDYLAQYHCEACPEVLGAVSYMTVQQSSKYIRERYRIPASPQEIVRQWQEMTETYYREKIPMKKGAKEFLHRLHRSGVRLCIATSCMKVLCEAALSSHGVYELFDAIVYSDEVGKNKDFPDIYLECAHRVETDIRDCMAFEDILPAVRTAHGIGLRVTAVEDAFALADRALLRAEADRYIRDFTEA